MLWPFSEYLKKNYLPDKLNVETLRLYALDWFVGMLDWTWAVRKKFFNQLMMPLFRGGDGNSTRTILYEKFKLWTEGLTEEEFIDRLNTYFFQFSSLIERNAVAHFARNPLEMPFGFYPFPPFERSNGVQMICRLRFADGSIMRLSNDDLYARSAVGAGDTMKQEIKNFVLANINSCDWMKTALAAINFSLQFRSHVDMSEPHAEDVWFIKHGQVLINILKNNRFNNENVSDTFPLSYLDGSRIEFVLSSSPCEECKVYFQALRKALNAHKIQLPIVIFANRHTNTDEKDCAIFIVTQSGEYQQLPIQWNGELIRERSLVRHLPPPISLTADYKAVLTLQIFGDALLPRLAYLQPAMISTFLSGLLMSESTNYLMVDWVRYYFKRVLAISPFDFSPTTINKSLSDSDKYSTIDYHFLTSSMTIPGMLEYAKKLILLAVNKPENVTGFFLLICKNHGDFTCQFLTGNSVEKIDDLHLSSELKSIAQTINDATTWDVKTAPKEVLRTSDFLKENPVYVYNYRANDLSHSLNSTWEYIHFLSIKPMYQRNVLNALFTHPARSPLGKANASYTNKGITYLIEFTLKAIKHLALQNGRWNMQIIERIFNAFRDKFFDQELWEAIEQLWEADHSKYLPQLERIFSREEAMLGDQVQVISFGSSDEEDTDEEDIAEEDADEEDILDSEEKIYFILPQKRKEMKRDVMVNRVLQSVTEKTPAFSVAIIANDFFRKNLQTLPPGVSFFRRLHDEYISEHRHEDPRIQREYDQRFGLVIRN